MKEKRLDARNKARPPAKKKSEKAKKEEWLSNIVIRPVRPKN